MSISSRRRQRVLHAQSTASPKTGYTPPGMRELPGPLYAVTIDNASGISQNLANTHKASLQALPHMPTTRIVFDEGIAATEYVTEITTLQPASYLMGELLDSFYLPTYTVQQMTDRTTEYVTAFGDSVDLWEIGNEVNGNWTGDYSEVSAKIQAAYGVVKAAGKRTALTLYYNLPSSDGIWELYPHDFATLHVPQAMREGIDYLLLSYYPTQNGNVHPSAAEWKAYYQQMRTLFPNALVGFGEVGLPDPVTAGTLATAQWMVNYYYGLQIDLPYYIGGYFYWYYAEDAIPTTKPIWQNMYDAMLLY